VTAAVGLASGANKAEAIAALGAKLEYLSESLRERLVTAAIRLASSEDKAKAIAGLGEKLEYLIQSQLETIVTAATAISRQHRARALVGLAAAAA